MQTSPILIPADGRAPGDRFDAETCARAEAVFRRFGACLLERALPEAWVDQAHDAATRAFDHRIDAAGTLGLGLDGGYQEIVQRMEGRYDMLLDADLARMAPPLAEQMALEAAPWGGLITALLGPAARRLHAGLLMTLPGAAPHPWHTDGPPLFTGPDAPVLPAHCINIFVPLVDQTSQNGGTDLWLGTHTQTSPRPTITWSMTPDPTKMPVSLICPRGSVLLFDYRLQHRAHPHRGAQRRPVFYMSYARPWFSDRLNFPENSVHDHDTVSP